MLVRGGSHTLSIVHTRDVRCLIIGPLAAASERLVVARPTAAPLQASRCMTRNVCVRVPPPEQTVLHVHIPPVAEVVTDAE